MTDTQHTPWTNPGAHGARLRELPSAAAAIADALEGFVIHHAVARSLGYGVPPAAERDRDLRFASRLLAETVRRDARPLSQRRALADYLYGTCHDFALLAASVLRENGVAARLRVGFANYFRAACWEDHWVCEHRSGDDWAILDAQLGPLAREGLRIGFDVADVPPAAWRSAGSIWRAIRSGEVDPGSCGYSAAGISGAWWAASAVLRDAAALAGVECLPWDYWGPSRSFCASHDVTDEQARDIDALAAALDPAPANRRAAKAVFDRFSWARPTVTIMSFPEGGEGSEVAIAPG